LRQSLSLSILDLGTGLADIPRAIVAWMRERNYSVTIEAVDVNPHVVEFAGEACRDWPEIKLAQHDLRSLPYAKASFDIVLCSQALHHFGEADAVTILRRIQEIARVGYLVNDLRRNRLGIWTTELLARTVVRKGLIRHDAPKSCRAAFTMPELRAMALEADLKNFQIKRRQAGFHMVLEGTV
jgi:2-polyprenyl-3-methyl-5-hydroxy-6-metoxy-1,4-benzoquinol methylase